MFGVWCLKVSSGYKIFDPYSGSATKIFDDSADRDLVVEEIRQQTEIGNNRFAPAMLAASEADAWYREELMSGETGYYFSPRSSREFMKIYSLDVAPVLLELMMFRASSSVTIAEYIQNMPDVIQSEVDRITELDAATGRVIQTFYDDVLAQVNLAADQEVCLVFAHGDVHLFNLFKTSDGIKLIDWEGIGEQSLLFDYFTYFFSHLWTGKTEEHLVAEVDQGIDDMINRLQTCNEDLATSLRTHARLYRMLYYLERLYAFSTKFKMHPKPLLDWINVYRKFEENKEMM